MKKLFSLIELMVVVAIIGILVSLLLPSLGRARETARLASCVSNSKQHAIALAQYQIENNNDFPAYQVAGVSGNGQRGSNWFGAQGYQNNALTPELRPLNPYLQNMDGDINMKVAECPSEEGVTRDEYAKWGNSYWSNKKNVVRDGRDTQAGSGYTPKNDDPLKVTQLNSPSRFISHGELGGMWSIDNDNRATQAWNYYHSEMGNYKWIFVFGDGHAANTKIIPGLDSYSNYEYTNK
jgi:prepilin-type N-terminal cleavage/methylation domain-containing protein